MLEARPCELRVRRYGDRTQHDNLFLLRRALLVTDAAAVCVFALPDGQKPEGGSRRSEVEGRWRAPAFAEGFGVAGEQGFYTLEWRSGAVERSSGRVFGEIDGL